MGEWQETTLGDLVELFTGFAFKSAEFSDVGVRLARGDNVKRGIFEWGNKTRYWSKVTPDLDRYLLREDDVLIGMDGSRVGENWARVREADLPCLLVQRVARLRSGPRLHQKYLWYLIANPTFVNYVKSDQTGSAIPHISGGQIRAFQVKCPPLDDQKKIAAILGALDDKIDLNRRMNETLESIARAIFKDWFVDFGPTRAKMEGCEPYLAPDIWALFPDRLDDEGKPEGWKTCPLSSIANLARESITPASHPEKFFDHFSIPAFDNGQAPVREAGVGILSNKTLVPPDAVLLSKLNPEIPRVWLVETDSALQSICSTEFLVFSPKLPSDRAFLYSFVTESTFIQRLVSMVTGTSKSHQRVSPQSVMTLDIITADRPIMDAFGDMATTLLDQVTANRRETRVLAATRDLLLPKLMSGEIRVKDAEKIAGVAL